MLEWILPNKYGIQDIIHYLDDYFTVGPPVSDKCSRALATTKATSTRLRVPLAPEKSVGPTTCIIFLGIELDSIELCARLPSDKLIELRGLITTWFGKRSCTRRELESLVGKLQHASAVVRPGRMLLRRLFDALRTTRLHHHYYRLSPECKLDIAWWNELLTDWNGASFFKRPGWEPAPDIHISSNASGKLGYGVSITTNGLKHGRWLPWNPCVLHTRNSSRSCQRVRFGVENGNKNAASSGVTTKASWQ